MFHRARVALASLSTLVLLCLVAPGAAATEGQLAATGAPIRWAVVAAIAVVVVGVGALLLSRRNRK